MTTRGTELTMSGKSSAKAKPANAIDGMSEDSLGAIFGAFQAAVWLIGMAILAWQDWWWPGILVLTAISGVTAPIFGAYITRRHEKESATKKQVKVETERAEALPHQCVACGAPLSATSVIWRSQTTASCPYCNSSIKATRPKSS